MKLLTDELRKTLPPLYAQEKEKDPIVHLKLFTPWTGWTWYITEGSPEEDDFILFGYVIGQEREWAIRRLMSLKASGGRAACESSVISTSSQSAEVRSKR
jgi:hypothetical protein